MKKNILSAGDERAYPVLICDEKLFIVDLNDSANDKGLSQYLFTNMASHLELRDATTLRAFLRRVRRGENNIKYVEVPVEGFKGGKVALVTVRTYFDKYFFEFSLFRSNAAVLSDSNPINLLLPGNEYPAEYYLSRSGADVETTAIRLNRLFASGMLLKLYMKASEPKRQIKRFDAAEILKLMATRVSELFTNINAKITFSFRNKETFFCDYIDMSDYINLLALILSLVSGISKSGRIAVSADCGADTMKVYFDTELKEPAAEEVGDFCFLLVGEAYPAYATYADIIKYMCDLNGLRFYADIEGENSFTGELILSALPSEDEIILRHPEQIDIEGYIKSAEEFIALLDGCNE